MRRCHFFASALSQCAERWWIPILAAGLCLAPLAVRSAGLPGRALPVPRERLHADGDVNRIYDDLEARLARTDPGAAVPVVILFEVPLAQVDLAALPARVGAFPVTARFPGEAAVAASLTLEQVRSLAALPFVTHVQGDEWLTVARETALPAFGVTKARDAFGRSGDGDGAPESYSAADHTIAVIDTGIDGGHDDFYGGKIIGWLDMVNAQSSPYDDMGHGTHVASIAAGRERDGVSGVAPGAALVGIKVINKNGNARTTDVVRGLDWCIANRDEYGIRIINLSLSSTGSGDGTDIMSRAIRRCVAAGMVVCVAAGNQGPATYTIPAPGAAADAITVGNMQDPVRGGFAVWTSSGRGPTADRRVKPDLVAPGFQVVAALADTFNASIPQTGSGMATPFVAGVCALMLEANPGLQPAGVKQLLRQTAVDFGPEGQDVDYGAGRLDAYAAVRAAELPAHQGAGAGPPVPDHHFFSGSLAPRASQEWTISVTDTRHPIAAVLIASDWTSGAPCHFQIELRDPAGRVVASAAQDRRAQTISVQPMKTGTYSLRVDLLAGQGPYFVDVSCDADEAPAEARGARRP